MIAAEVARNNLVVTSGEEKRGKVIKGEIKSETKKRYMPEKRIIAPFVLGICKTFVDMMVFNRYYKAMSLAKQIGLAILATVSLLIFGLGSYYASRQLFPDPTSNNQNQNNNNNNNTDAPKVSDLKKLEPKNIQTTFEENEIVLSFETVEAVGSTVYVTSDQTERVDQVMKDYRNGIQVAGRWFTLASDTDPSATHIARIPMSVLNESGRVYYYILLRSGEYWLPYGGTMDYVNGPTAPYVIQK